MKIIVTHFAPDVDALTSIWLIKRFLPGWREAEVKFVAAGETLNNRPPDENPEILHVDTGLGKLDHHQEDDETCAAWRTLKFIQEKQKTKIKRKETEGEALRRLVEVVSDIDHFREVYFPNPAADFYDFNFSAVLDGWRLLYPQNDQKIVELGLLVLDGIYKKFQDKVWAEKEIREKGREFLSRWGKGIGLETINDEVVRLAQRLGYVLVVRKDPHKDYVRIKALPHSSVDFTKCYNILRKKDPEATWYLHSSKKMILNGSLKNPATRPTKLTLCEIIEVLKR